MPRRLTWLDVFTSRPLAGNGLAVVHDADELTDETMLAFARETKLSETTFVQTASEAGADYRNRIWMPTRELPFAGHPSLGTAIAVADARGEREARYVQQTTAGLQPIEIEFRGDGHTARASMLQEPTVFGPERDPAVVLAALGLDEADVHPELPPQVVSCGVPQLIVPVRDETVLARVHPDERLIALLNDDDAICAYVAWPEPDGEHVQARSFFVEGQALLEDPATGSAAGPLCAYLHARGGATHLEIVQGVAMGRPSRLLCEAGERVRVAGDAVILIDGAIEL